MLHFPVWWKINFLKSPPQPLFVLCFNLYIGNHRDYSITQRLFKCECTKNCRIFIISWIASVKLLRKHALEVARNPCITFEPTRSVCRRSLRAAPLEDHLPAAGLPRVLSPKPLSRRAVLQLSPHGLPSSSSQKSQESLDGRLLF